MDFKFFFLRTVKITEIQLLNKNVGFRIWCQENCFRFTVPGPEKFANFSVLRFRVLKRFNLFCFGVFLYVNENVLSPQNNARSPHRCLT